MTLTRSVRSCGWLTATAICAAAAGRADAQSFTLQSYFGGTGTTNVTLINLTTGQVAQVGSQFQTTKPTFAPNTATSGSGSTGGGLGYIDATGAPVTVGEAWTTVEFTFVDGLSGGPEVRVRARSFVTYDPTQWGWLNSTVLSTIGSDPANIFTFATSSPTPFVEERTGTWSGSARIAVEARSDFGEFPAGNLSDGLIRQGAYRIGYNVGLIATPAEPTRSLDLTYRFIVPAPGAAGLCFACGAIALRRRRHA